MSLPLASTSRITFSSSLTLCLPIREATSPSVEMRLVLTFQQPGEHPQVAGELRLGRFQDQRRRSPAVLLAVRSMRPLRCSIRIRLHGMS